MSYSHSGGVSNMMKEGSQHLSGLEEAVLRNIEACKEFGLMVRTGMGPNGMNKMVINHLDKLFVTSDAGTIIRELEVQHPAAKLIVMSSQRQAEEVGDGTGMVVSLSAKLLEGAEELIHLGLHPSDVVDGYVLAAEKAQEIMKTLGVAEMPMPATMEGVGKAIATTFGAKQPGMEGFFGPLVAGACLQLLAPGSSSFNVDNVRVAKIQGGSNMDSIVINGLVLPRPTKGSVKKMDNAKIIAFSCEVEPAATETKGTVLLETADQLMNYNTSEEQAMEDLVKTFTDCGANVVIANAKISEMAVHFFDRAGMMVIMIPSKFEMRRVCNSTGCSVMTKLQAAKPEELGSCSHIAVEEIGDRRAIVFRHDDVQSKIATIVLRGATSNGLDDLQRAVDNSVNAVKVLLGNNALCAGGGAAEIECAKQLTEFGETQSGMEQYAVGKFAECLEIIPHTLAENAGYDTTEIIAQLYAAHNKEGGECIGIDIEEEGVCDMKERYVLDSLAVKANAVKLAADVAITVLRVDQIIMAKPAGGPKV